MLIPIYAVLLLMLYWWWLDYAPWNPLGGPGLVMSSAVMPEEIGAGGRVSIEFAYTIRRDCPRRVDLWLYTQEADPTLLRSHIGSTSGTGKGERTRTYVVDVPQDAAPGPAWLRSVGEFRCNPLRAWRYVHDAAFRIAR